MNFNKRNRLLISCLVLNGSMSGYKTIIKNLVKNSLKDTSQNYQNIFVFQRSGWESLEINLKDFFQEEGEIASNRELYLPK